MGEQHGCVKADVLPPSNDTVNECTVVARSLISGRKPRRIGELDNFIKVGEFVQLTVLKECR